MKVMLIQPKPPKDSIGLWELMCCEPLGLEYVGTALKNEGHEVVLIDLALEKKSLEFFLKAESPEIVMFTAYLINIGTIKELSDMVKKYNTDTITAVGGSHSEVHPEDFDYCNIDYVLSINGVKNAMILLDAMEKKIVPEFEHDEIDTGFQLPKVDRSLTAKYRHRYYYAYGKSYALLKTSFGCPHDCKFCFSIVAARHQYIERDIKTIMEEIMEIEEENVFVVDDNFLANRKRIIEFCELLKKHNVNKKFYVNARADFICANEDIIKLVAEHGINSIFVGLESFKQEDLNNLGKKSDVDLAIKASAICRKYNIMFHCSAILGYDWDKKDFKEFAKWLKKNIYYRDINFMPLAPLLGTEMANDYDDRLLVSRTEYEKWDFQHVIIRPSKIKTSEFYIETIKIYFKVSFTFRNFVFINKTSGVRASFYIVRGIIKNLWSLLKLVVKYKKIGD